MQQKQCLKTILVFTIFIIFQSGLRGAEAQELSVEDLLYKGRTELSKDNPTGAIVYFTKALNKCNPGSSSYNSRYGRCNFFVGEGYFQKFEMQRNISDAKTAIKYFETVIDFGKKTTQDYPSLAKGRIKQIRRALNTNETGVSSEIGRTFKVKTVSKGKIIANSWNLYVNGERIDNPFVELFFIEDHSGDTPKALRKAVYISDAGAAEVARKLGIQRITQNKYSYDRYDVLNISRTFRKFGFPDIVLKNGERFNRQWAIIEYDLNMPALPVKLFEHFGASVQASWSERKVMINAKAGSPITKDWFDLVGELRLPPSGAGGNWIIGFQEFQLPRKIYPGQFVQGRVDLQVKGNARNSANAVIYISLFGDWSPSTKLARIYKGTVGIPRRVSMPFSFKAPSKPGTYRLRCPMVLAFAPVKNFYGSKPGGQNDPGVGPYTEVSFVVAKPQVNKPATTQKPPQIKDNKPVYPKGMVWVSINGPGVSGHAGVFAHEGFSGRMSKYETTNAQYCEFLNAALTTDDITVTMRRHRSTVKGANGSNPGADFVGEMYYDLDGPGLTYDGVTNGGAARINYTGSLFTVDSGFEKHPVNHVSWYGATAFCNYYGYRLPTEWEWMAVADYAGSYGYNKYGCGTSINNSKANYLGSTHPYGTTPVGTFGVYGYGMADMTGNVWELVSLDKHGFRITCGGSWHTNKELCTVRFRYRDGDLHKSGNNIGFRVCRGQRVTVAKPQVNESTTTQKPPESASIPDKDKDPAEAARKFITALYSRSYDDMLEVVSDDVYAYQGGKGSYQLPYGRKAFKEFASSFSFDKPPKIISVKEKHRLKGGTIALIEAVMQQQGKNKYTCTLWFKKVNSQWLLFTPTTNLAGYRNSDIQAALRSFANTWARRGNQRYVNCRIKKAVPNTLQHTASLWLEIEYEYTSNNYYGDGRAKSGTRISAVWMNRKSGSWEYGGMYNQ